MAFVEPVMDHWLEQVAYTYLQGSMTGSTKAMVCAILSIGSTNKRSLAAYRKRVAYMATAGFF